MANLNFGIFYYQHIVSVKDMLPKVWLFSISCILISINNSFSSASIISVNNMQYPDALHSPYNHHKETQAEEMDGFVGRIFEYKIPESLFPCEVESYVVRFDIIQITSRVKSCNS